MAEPEVSQSGQSVDGNGDGGRGPTSSVSLSVSKEAALESLIFTKGIKLAKSRFAVLSAPYRPRGSAFWTPNGDNLHPESAPEEHRATSMCYPLLSKHN